jgi:ATP-binding cassette subfamily B multidrug efflux pump
MKKKKSTIIKLLAYIGPYSIIFIISLLMTAASVVCSLLVPVMFGRGIDLIVSKGNVDIDGIIRTALIIVIIIAAGALAQWVTGYLNNALTFKIIKRLRGQVFKKIEELPLSYLDSKTSGELLSRCVTDIEQISDGLLMGFTQVFNGILTIICTIVFMAGINPFITIAVVALSPASFALTKFIASRTHEMFVRQSESRGEMTSFTDESIENMKLIYAFDHKDESRSEFDEKNDTLSKYSLKATFFSSLVNPSTRLIYSALYAIVTIMGGFYVIGGSMSVGSLSAMLGYTNQYSKPFNEITGTITEFQNALASAARVFEVLESSSAESPYEPFTAKDSHNETVSFDSVCFSYDPNIPLIEDFNLNVSPGQRVAIVGPTGCGKTTLINLLMRFYDVNSGSIKIDGKDIRNMSHREVRSHYGMVLQDIWLKAGTIRENIAYGRPDAPLSDVKTAAENAYADDFIEKLPDGYDTVIGEDGGNLSEGQKQLLCIARVMLSDPSILILDEATSSVDSMTEIRITKAFDRLMKGRTSFIVAHRLSTIVNSDLILVMNSGHIIEQGTHEELLAQKGFYYDLYQSRKS